MTPLERLRKVLALYRAVKLATETDSTMQKRFELAAVALCVADACLEVEL